MSQPFISYQRWYAPMPHAVKRQFCSSHCLKHHLSVIGGITRGAEGSSCKYATIRSREQMVSASWPLLLREITGKILVIWDGASIHRCQAVKDFTSKPGAGRIHLERLPAYAPELNPQEGVWNLLKRVERGNVCCHDLQQVRQQLTLAKERLRHRKSTLAQCYAHAGYSL